MTKLIGMLTALGVSGVLIIQGFAAAEPAAVELAPAAFAAYIDAAYYDYLLDGSSWEDALAGVSLRRGRDAYTVTGTTLRWSPSEAHCFTADVPSPDTVVTPSPC
jgi:hypothetical protein